MDEAKDRLAKKGRVKTLEQAPSLSNEETTIWHVYKVLSASRTVGAIVEGDKEAKLMYNKIQVVNIVAYAEAIGYPPEKLVMVITAMDQTWWESQGF